MTNETKVQRKKGQPTNGKSDLDRLKEMTEEEIENNAKDDEDLPLQSDDDLKRFKRVVPKKD
ncbi:MAG: hypothetical protein ABNH16_10780 [Thalassolituus sp.]|jgi:hypothetical protein|nr:MAG: hypothetical protein COA68_06640 [Oceanobacter sp.]|tara:strand:- start:67 stop:252 length:186 start_codon:yes stop_codon:yes gene_type:complete